MSLYIKIRNFDEYKGKNPFKLFLREIALRMWDYQDCKDENAKFLNKKRTEINRISFLKYIIMSLFYKSEG